MEANPPTIWLRTERFDALVAERWGLGDGSWNQVAERLNEHPTVLSKYRRLRRPVVAGFIARALVSLPARFEELFVIGRDA